MSFVSMQNYGNNTIDSILNFAERIEIDNKTILFMNVEDAK